MHTRRYLPSAIAAAALAAISIPVHGQERAWQRLLAADETEQTAWVNAHLSKGMPPSDEFAMLIRNKSEIVLPLIEQKIEDVLRSPSPAERFTDKSVDPQKFVDRAASSITATANVRSLKEASKLIKIDEKRFGWMVEGTLAGAQGHNPFPLVYEGLELGDPAVESRIATWVRAQFADKGPPPTGPGMAAGAEAVILQRNGRLAEAMVERYAGMPTEVQWGADPIVSRLEPVRALILHDDVMRAASDALERRTKR
jgi:hypothetical protein